MLGCQPIKMRRCREKMEFLRECAKLDAVEPIMTNLQTLFCWIYCVMAWKHQDMLTERRSPYDFSTSIKHTYTTEINTREYFMSGINLIGSLKPFCCSIHGLLFCFCIHGFPNLTLFTLCFNIRPNKTFLHNLSSKNQLAPSLKLLCFFSDVTLIMYNV